MCCFLSLSLDIYIYIYVYIYIYISLSLSIYIYINMILYIYICASLSLSLSIYIYIYIYIYIFTGYRLCRRPPKSRLWMTFEGTGSLGVLPASLLWHLGCTGLTRAPKVRYLGLLSGREHRLQGQGEVGGPRPVDPCGAELWPLLRDK